MKVAVILAGCGHIDGAEIHEATLTLLALDDAGAHYQCLAPDAAQAHVVNHLTRTEAKGESRNVLVEAARIARGNVIDVAKADAGDFDALIIPGGNGAAKNLCSFAAKGADMSVNADVARLAKAMHAAGKPVGLICIAPVMAPLLFGKGVKCTIGNDPGTAAAIAKMGGVHVPCPVNECVVDEARKVVTTPAYMLAQRISETNAGIRRLVQEVLRLAAG